jgi:hypothetical protein
MEKKALLAELLYLGFVNERNSILIKSWNLGLRKVLKIEFELWRNVALMILDDGITGKDKELLNEFFQICNTHPRIKKNHKLVNDIVFDLKKNDYKELLSGIPSNEEGKTIIRLMIDIINNLLESLQSRKILINKKELYQSFRAIHNLPRYFLKKPNMKSKEAFEESGIDFKNAMEYSFQNMDERMKVKYSNILSKAGLPT